MPGNYRPISLIDIIQKIVGKMVLNKLQEWILDLNVLSPFQAGFRAATSTVEQVFRFGMIYWKTVTLNKGAPYAALFDLRSALT